MQLDLHYYGTYALARTAGLKPDACRTIAYASQYVDDSITREIQAQQTGARLISVETAHHCMDIRNTDDNDQRFIWLPFHFLPGNEGDTLAERLICRQDSGTARQMFEHHLALVLKPPGRPLPFELELMGLTAHVYADCYAHFGFAGISSPLNRIHNRSIRILAGSPEDITRWENQLDQFLEEHGEQGGCQAFFTDILELLVNVGTEIATGALGHGPVGIYPDLPFLHWEYTHDEGILAGQRVERYNPIPFAQSCRDLHGFFRRLAVKRPDLADGQGGVAYPAIGGAIRTLLAEPGDLPERCRRWQEAIAAGGWYPATQGEAIPPYSPRAWDDARDDFPHLPAPEQIATHGVYRFYQAASLHLHYVLRELLPGCGIIVV